MKWTDVQDVVFALMEAHPEADPMTLRFTELHAWILELAGFEGQPEESNEKILEAIQMAWLDERQP